MKENTHKNRDEDDLVTRAKTSYRMTYTIASALFLESGTAQFAETLRNQVLLSDHVDPGEYKAFVDAIEEYQSCLVQGRSMMKSHPNRGLLKTSSELLKAELIIIDYLAKAYKAESDIADARKDLFGEEVEESILPEWYEMIFQRFQLSVIQDEEQNLEDDPICPPYDPEDAVASHLDRIIGEMEKELPVLKSSSKEVIQNCKNLLAHPQTPKWKIIEGFADYLRFLIQRNDTAKKNLNRWARHRESELYRHTGKSDRTN